MSEKIWNEFHQKSKERPPHALLMEALTYVIDKNKAIDIGAGSLRDSKLLLNEGFEVTAIDSNPVIQEVASSLDNDKLSAFTSSFEKFNFPENEYDVTSAMFALPFIKPEHFDSVILKIKSSVKSGGIFCGNFFGINDTWSINPVMTFHTKEQVTELLDGFEIIKFEEVEEDGTAVLGGMKHWHFFNVIGRKR